MVCDQPLNNGHCTIMEKVISDLEGFHCICMNEYYINMHVLYSLLAIILL